MMPNLLQYPICLFGAWRAGCTVVSCNPLYTPRELAHQLADSGARAIVVADNFAATLQQALPQTALEHVVVTSIGEQLGWPRGPVVDFVVRRVKRMVPAWSLPGARRLRDVLAEGERLPHAAPGAGLAGIGEHLLDQFGESRVVRRDRQGV
ncbi:AMP-binding enzyme domain protein, partial [Bordetella bronchiseptica 980-2]